MDWVLKNSHLPWLKPYMIIWLVKNQRNLMWWELMMMSLKQVYKLDKSLILHLDRKKVNVFFGDWVVMEQLALTKQLFQPSLIRLTWMFKDTLHMMHTKPMVLLVLTWDSVKIQLKLLIWFPQTLITLLVTIKNTSKISIC